MNKKKKKVNVKHRKNRERVKNLNQESMLKMKKRSISNRKKENPTLTKVVAKEPAVKEPAAKKPAAKKPAAKKPAAKKPAAKKPAAKKPAAKK